MIKFEAHTALCRMASTIIIRKVIIDQDLGAIVLKVELLTKVFFYFGVQVSVDVVRTKARLSRMKRRVGRRKRRLHKRGGDAAKVVLCAYMM